MQVCPVTKFIPTLPSSPLVITEHRAGLPVPDSCLLLAVCFTHRNVYKPVLLSQSVPLSPFPSVSTNPFSKSASPFLPCKEVDIALLNHYSDELSITRKGM